MKWKSNKKVKESKQQDIYNEVLETSDKKEAVEEVQQENMEELIQQASVYEDDQEYEMKTMRLDEPDYTLEIGLASHIGRREYQQDVAMASYENKDGDTKAIAILCDGMGGMNSGEIASNICVNQIFDDYSAKEIIEDYNAFLVDEACKADEYVSSLTDREGEPLNSGCTLVSVIVEKKKMYWASVGDSRIYLIRDQEMAQVTTDHNYKMLLQERVAAGILSEEEAQADKNREALISYIGMCGLRYIDSNVKPFDLKPDDFVLICSDGLYRTLSHQQMKYIIEQNYNNVSLAVQELVEAAIRNGPATQDNTSAILIKCI